jgi:hypothetical protein
VFCDPDEPHELPCLDGETGARAHRAAAALAAVPAFGGPAERDAGLRAAVRPVAGLVRCLSPDADPVDGELLSTRSPVRATSGLAPPR